MLRPYEANLVIPAYLSFHDPLLERGQLAESELTPIGLANLPLALRHRLCSWRDGNRLRRAAGRTGHLIGLQGHGDQHRLFLDLEDVPASGALNRHACFADARIVELIICLAAVAAYFH